jgi:hypothetical protein
MLTLTQINMKEGPSRSASGVDIKAPQAASAIPRLHPHGPITRAQANQESLLRDRLAVPAFPRAFTAGPASSSLWPLERHDVVLEAPCRNNPSACLHAAHRPARAHHPFGDCRVEHHTGPTQFLRLVLLASCLAHVIQKRRGEISDMAGSYWRGRRPRKSAFLRMSSRRAPTPWLRLSDPGGHPPSTLQNGPGLSGSTAAGAAVAPSTSAALRRFFEPSRGAGLPTGGRHADPILLGEFAMPILLWHLPLVIFFGSWDVAVSPSEKRSVETPFDARLAPETPELPPFRNPAN